MTAEGWFKLADALVEAENEAEWNNDDHCARTFRAAAAAARMHGRMTAQKEMDVR